VIYFSHVVFAELLKAAWRCILFMLQRAAALPT